MSETTVYGVWETFWDRNELVSLHWTLEEAEEKAKSGGTYEGLDYGGLWRWHVEQHEIVGDRS